MSLLAGAASAGPILDFIRSYDLNDYALGLAYTWSENPFIGASGSGFAYPYLTSFRHPAFTKDWFLIRDADIGFRYVTEKEWEFGVVGRLQTLGLGGKDNDQVLGLNERRWSAEAGPTIGWRGWPVHFSLTTYWELPNRHDGTTTDFAILLPREWDRGYLVPSLEFTYMSQDYADYYFGVSPSEVAPGRPEYRPGSAINTELVVRLGYEISPQWLFTTTVGLEFLDSTITDSPIVDKDQLWSASIALAYNADLFQPRDYDTSLGRRQSIEFRVGAFASNVSSRVSRDAPGGGRGEEIDLEDLLGVEDTQTVLQVDTIFRLAFFHRLEVGYFELDRRGATTLQRDIDFGDETFPAGTDVTTKMSSETLRFTYGYSLMRDSQKELGVSAGLHYTRFDTRLSSETTGQTERADVKVPLPTIGVFGSLALGQKWLLAADINLFGLEFDRFEGVAAFLNLRLQRNFGESFNAGLGFNYYGTRIESEEEDSSGVIRSDRYGPLLYFGMRF